jgi:hypothetical protein
MYGLPDSAVVGTAKRLKKVAKKSVKKRAKAQKVKAEKPERTRGSITIVVEEEPKPYRSEGQGFVEAMIYLVMPMIWLAERYNKKRAEQEPRKETMPVIWREKKSDTPEK